MTVLSAGIDKVPSNIEYFSEEDIHILTHSQLKYYSVLDLYSL